MDTLNFISELILKAILIWFILSKEKEGFICLFGGMSIKEYCKKEKDKIHRAEESLKNNPESAKFAFALNLVFWVMTVVFIID